MWCCTSCAASEGLTLMALSGCRWYALRVGCDEQHLAQVPVQVLQIAHLHTGNQA